MKKFKEMPVPLQKQIAARLGLSCLAIILFIILLFLTREVSSVLPCLALTAFCTVSAYCLYRRAVRKEYVVLHGVCSDVELTVIRKRLKAFRMATDTHIVRVIVKQGLRRITVGARLDLYVANNATLEERNSVLTLHQYLALDIL